MRTRAALRPPAAYASMLRRWSRVKRWRIDDPASLEFYWWLTRTAEGRAWCCYARALRAVFRNRQHWRSSEPRACEALSELHHALRAIHSRLIDSDYDQAELAAARGDAALNALSILALEPLAERGLPFMHDEINKLHVLKLARRLKAAGQTRKQVRDGPEMSSLLAELGIEEKLPRTLDRWLDPVYGKQPNHRPKRR